MKTLIFVLGLVAFAFPAEARTVATSDVDMYVTPSGGAIDATGAQITKQGATGIGCRAIGSAKILTGGTGNPWFFPGNSPCQIDGTSSFQ